jgi:molybdate transport system ATP-binding protein
VLKTEPTGLLLDWDGLSLEVSPQPAEVGEMVTAYIQPEDIKILYPDRPLMSSVRYNQVTGKILSRRRSSSFQTLFVLLPNGHQKEISFPASTYAPLLLQPGEEIKLSLRKEGVVLLQPP